MAHPKTYPYGFSLLPAASEAVRPETYASEPFTARYVFSYDARREALRSRSEDGTEVLVFGRCYVLHSAGGAGPDAAEFLAAGIDASEGEFLDRLDRLAGRWIALTAQGDDIVLYHDAVGTRSVYYDAEAGAAASHATMLGEALGRAPSGVSKPSMTWDLSNFEGITALLPNHRLRVQTGEVERYWPREPNPWDMRSEEDRLDAVVALWHQQMGQVLASGLPVCMALSGGLDSRAALALSAPFMDRIRTFTYGASATARSTSAEVLERDVDLAQTLAELLRLDHRVIPGNPAAPGLDPSAVEAVSRNSLTVHGRWLLPHYLAEFPAPDGLVLRANAFEVGQHKWSSPADDDPAKSAKALWLRRARSTGVQIPGSTLEDHVDRAFSPRPDSDLHGYLASDLTHWEFRLGRWAAEAFNEIDLAFEPLVPLSCRAMLLPLLAFQRQQRADQVAFRELINRTVPVLNFFGINATENLYETWRDAARDSGPSQQLASHGILALPLAKFQPGGSETAQVFAAPLAGHISFEMETFWANASGDRSFEYRITVDDRPVHTVQGGASKGLRHVEIRNVRADSRVGFSIVALKTRLQPSWERATKVRLRSIRFASGSPQGAVTASSRSDPAS